MEEDRKFLSRAYTSLYAKPRKSDQNDKTEAKMKNLKGQEKSYTLAKEMIEEKRM